MVTSADRAEELFERYPDVTELIRTLTDTISNPALVERGQGIRWHPCQGVYSRSTRLSSGEAAIWEVERRLSHRPECRRVFDAV